MVADVGLEPTRLAPEAYETSQLAATVTRNTGGFCRIRTYDPLRVKQEL